MTDKVEWPSWRFGPNGQSDIFENAADVPAGWADHPTRVKGADAAPKPPVVQTAGQQTREEREKKKDPAAGTGGDVDAAGWPWSADLHSATKTKTQAGLWRMKVGVVRPGPKSVGQQGEGAPETALDL